METEIYSLPDRFAPGPLVQVLQQHFPRIEENRQRLELEVYDTFDWRLFEQGRLLVREEARFVLVELRSDRELISTDVLPKNDLRFWWQLPESQLRNYLRQVLDVRALMRLIRLEKNITTLNLLNEEQKTVARVAIETAATAEEKAANRRVKVCKLIPVRGYRKQFKDAGMTLASAGIAGTAGNLVIAALEASGLQPGGYSAKMDIALRPEMPAGEAARLILAHLARIVRLNENGIRKDTDSEFLHDFRVAIRRARSLLTLLKDVFDPEVNHSLKVDLQSAGKATNRLRDLDVYLLDQPLYEARIPRRLRSGIAPLFASLKRRRRLELKKTIRFLDSADYRRIIEHIETIAGQPPDPDNAGEPIEPLASRVIYRRYRKIIKAGSRIDASTPDADLHRLRIECKKLRYALEFFKTLYPADEMKGLIKQLKLLQDNLGRFNDLSVQQDFLHAFLATTDGQKPKAVGLAAATGALIGRLDLEHRQVRDAFLGVFATFNAAGNHRRYVRLFAGQQKTT